TTSSMASDDRNPVCYWRRYSCHGRLATELQWLRCTRIALCCPYDARLYWLYAHWSADWTDVASTHFHCLRSVGSQCHLVSSPTSLVYPSLNMAATACLVDPACWDHWDGA